MDFFENCRLRQMQKQQIEMLKKKQHEFHLLGHQKKIAGLTLFSFNTRTGEIKVAPVKREVFIDLKTHQPIKKEKIVVEPNCLYRQALNKANFIKKLKKMGFVYATGFTENSKA